MVFDDLITSFDDCEGIEIRFGDELDFVSVIKNKEHVCIGDVLKSNECDCDFIVVDIDYDMLSKCGDLRLTLMGVYKDMIDIGCIENRISRHLNRMNVMIKGMAVLNFLNKGFSHAYVGVVEESNINSYIDIIEKHYGSNAEISVYDRDKHDFFAFSSNMGERKGECYPVIFSRIKTTTI